DFRMWFIDSRGRAGASVARTAVTRAQRPKASPFGRGRARCPLKAPQRPHVKSRLPGLAVLAVQQDARFPAGRRATFSRVSRWNCVNFPKCEFKHTGEAPIANVHEPDWP